MTAIPAETAKPKRNYEKVLKKAAAAVAALSLSYLWFHENTLDLLGDFHRHRTPEEMDKAFAEAKLRRYQAADHEGRYMLQFLRPDSLDFGVIVGTLQDGNGFISKIQAVAAEGSLSERSRPVGDTCLTDRPYDTLRPETYNPEHGVAKLSEKDGVVTITPGDKEMPPLNLVSTGPNGLYQPADKVAEFILDYYECDYDQL